jgi:hypothetical protein
MIQLGRLTLCAVVDYFRSQGDYFICSCDEPLGLAHARRTYSIGMVPGIYVCVAIAFRN